MWRQLLSQTDARGHTYLAIAGILLLVAVTSFIAGLIVATTGGAAHTLPFWLSTMACAVVAGVLVWYAAKRGDALR